MMQSTYCVKSSGSLLSLSPALSNIFFRSSESCVVSLSRDEVAGLLFCCSRNSNSTAGSKKNITIFISEMCLEKQESNNKQKHNTHTHTQMYQIHAKYHTNLYSFAYRHVCAAGGGGRGELAVCVPAQGTWDGGKGRKYQHRWEQDFILKLCASVHFIFSQFVNRCKWILDFDPLSCTLFELWFFPFWMATAFIYEWCLHLFFSKKQSIWLNLIYTLAALWRSRRASSLWNLGRSLNKYGVTQICLLIPKAAP